MLSVVVLRSQGCICLTVIHLKYDRLEGILRNWINLVYMILEMIASRPLMYSFFFHSWHSLGRSLIKLNSLLSMEVLEGESAARYTISYIRYLTDAHYCLPLRLRRLIYIFFFFRIFVCSVLCKWTQSSIKCGMTDVCGGNQKEWKWVLSFTNVVCIVFQCCKRTNETEPLMDNVLGGSNSYY